MSITSTTNRMDYQGLGDGSDATWPYTFYISDASHLKVITTSTTGVETVESYSTGGVTGYNVSGVGASGGGVVTFGSSNIPAAGESITILRVVPITQTADIRNQGDFFPESHEDVFDKLVMIDQQQQDAIDRSIILPRSTVIADFDPELPTTLVGEASVALVTNATGDGWDVGPTTDEISNAQGYATAASASATLASQWASLTSGQVATTDYSAKAWAIGGTGVTDTASRGAAKEWAIETASTVDGTDYSAKEWAKGTQVRGIASGGSAKDWANYTSGTVDDTEYSAKKYAQDAAASAAAVFGQDVSFKVFADSPVTLVSGDRGKIISVDCTNGAVSITLPDIAGLTLTTPWSVIIKKTDSTANAVTVTRASTDTIDGATSVTLDTQYSGVMLFAEDSTAPDQWSMCKFGSSSGGGGGSSLKWIESTNAPTPIVENNLVAYEFDPDTQQEIYAMIKVPQSYIAGRPIKLWFDFYSGGNSGTVLLSTLATLIRKATDAVTSTTNQRTSTNSAVTLSAGTVDEPQEVSADLTSSIGQINSVSVSPGDRIFIKLFRDVATDTATATAKSLLDGSEVTFA